MSFPRPHWVRLPHFCVMRRNSSRGQSLVELALVAPVLLLLLLVAIDFGRVYLGYVNLQSVARIAANFAANNPTADWANSTDPKVLAYNRIISDDASATNCTLRPDVNNHNPPRPTYPSGTALGAIAEVGLTCDFGLITPIIRNVFGGNGTIAVSASAKFPIKSGGVAGISVGVGGPNIPAADFVGMPVSGTAPLDVAFTDLSTNGPTQWTWNFGDGNSSNLQNPTHQYGAAGIYTVSLTAQNANGFTTATKSSYIAVGGPTAAEFSAAPLTGSAPLAVTFQDLSSGAPNSWAWTFGDGGTSTAQSPSHTYLNAGSYSVTLSIDGPSGPASQTKAGYVIVGAAQCVVPNVSDGSTKKVQATSTLEGLGFTVLPVGDSSNWKVRFQNPAGGFSVDCGSTVEIDQ